MKRFIRERLESLLLQTPVSPPLVPNCLGSLFVPTTPRIRNQTELPGPPTRSVAFQQLAAGRSLLPVAKPAHFETEQRGFWPSALHALVFHSFYYYILAA